MENSPEDDSVLTERPFIAYTISCKTIILYYAIYGSTHKYKKAKIHLKYNVKYKKDMNTNMKALSSAR